MRSLSFTVSGFMSVPAVCRIVALSLLPCSAANPAFIPGEFVQARSPHLNVWWLCGRVVWRTDSQINGQHQSRMLD